MPYFSASAITLLCTISKIQNKSKSQHSSDKLRSWKRCCVRFQRYKIKANHNLSFLCEETPNAVVYDFKDTK